MLTETYRAMLIDWLESQNRGIVTYLYCSYEEQETQTLQNMVGSLLKQIVQRKATLPDEVLDLYEKHARNKTRPTLDELARLLVQEVKTCSAVFVVIDALDECPESGNIRATLLKIIQGLPSHTRVVVTSRYSPTILDRFEDIPHIVVEIRATEEDVKQYVQARAEGRIKKEKALAKDVRASPGLMEEIINTVAQGSRGMYVVSPFNLIPVVLFALISARSC